MLCVNLKYFICIIFSIPLFKLQDISIEDRNNIDIEKSLVSNVPFLYKSSAFLYCDEYETKSVSYDPIAYINSRVRKSKWSNVTFWRTNSKDPKNITFIKITNDDLKYFLNESTNSLEIRDLRRNDIENFYFCNSTSSSKTIAFYNQVLPYLYANDRESIIVYDGGSIQHDCRVLFGYLNGSNITWVWEREGKILVNNENVIIENVNNISNESRLIINEIYENQRGTYKCTAINMYGNYSRTFLIRVKDHLAPIWPAFGILVQMVFLAVFLFIYEKIKNKNKKKDDDNNKNQ